MSIEKGRALVRMVVVKAAAFAPRLLGKRSQFIEEERDRTGEIVVGE